MKKRIFAFFFVFLLCANLGWAEDVKKDVHVVKSGESAIGIATKVFGIAYRDLNLYARTLHSVHPGDVIRRSDLIGANPVNKKEVAKPSINVKPENAAQVNNHEVRKLKPALNPHLSKVVEYDENGRRIIREYNIAPLNKGVDPLSKAQLALDEQVLEYGLRVYCGEGKEKAKEILDLHKQVFSKGLRNVPVVKDESIQDGTEAEAMFYAGTNGHYSFRYLEYIVLYYGEKTQVAFVYPINDEWELLYMLKCGNWTFRKKKRQQQEFLLPPPPPPYIEPLPIVGNPQVQSLLDRIYLDQVNRAKQIGFDAIAGGAKMKYNDGGEDTSLWMYVSAFRETGPDTNGNKHRYGPAFRASMYQGSWSDPNGKSPNYYFDGTELSFGPEYRVLTPGMIEYIFNLDYVTQKNYGHSSDAWGNSKKTSEFEAGRISAQVHDMSRYMKTLLYDLKYGFSYTQGFKESQQSTWTDNIGNIRYFDDAVGVTGPSIYASAKLVKLPYEMSISADFWAQSTKNADVAKLSVYLDLFDDILMIGPRGSFGHYSNGNIWGIGPDIMFDFTALGKYLHKKNRSVVTKSATAELVSDLNDILAKENTNLSTTENVSNSMDPNSADLADQISNILNR